MSRTRYPRDVLARTAAVSTSPADLLRRLGAPVGSRTLGYIRGRLDHYGIDTSHMVDEPLPPREKRAYPRELLEHAAARSHSIREMFEHLGLSPDDGPYSHIRKRLDHYGIDTSHFTRGRRTSAELLPRQPLMTAAARSSSLAGLLTALGIADSGAARARVKRSLKEHGVPTGHFTGQAHGRGSTSPHRRTADDILRRRPPGSPRTGTPLLRRALDDLGVPHRCAECGVGDSWQGRRLVLEIDHVNGDRLDNRQENLRYLCPSCHSQTRSHSRPRRMADARSPVK
ncbi:HNH endonuclease [Streptomyces sp. NPDC005813]|uniref:HNH endonuclease n=1 Tax=Streptomyces sp. NPDC005813 TaxID=3155592 RepID=UPI0034031ADA